MTGGLTILAYPSEYRNSGNVLDDLPEPYKVCIYRLAQAALHNAVMHSSARNAAVRVNHRNRASRCKSSMTARCLIRRTRDLGLLGMEERVKRLGGSFAVQSQPGKGARLM
jgi:signal transduction histidine kinase